LLSEGWSVLEAAGENCLSKYTVDGQSVSGEQYSEITGEIRQAKLFILDNISAIGEEYKGVLMQANISQTVDMLSNALPALKAIK